VAATTHGEGMPDVLKKKPEGNVQNKKRRTNKDDWAGILRKFEEKGKKLDL